MCKDNGGIWWGPDDEDDDITADIPLGGFTNCCEVNDYVVSNALHDAYTIDPPAAVAIRDYSYKLVQNSFIPYVAGQPCATRPTSELEFYEIDKVVPTLDKDGTELDLQNLSSEQQQHYDRLSAELAILLDSEPTCPGDGNGDLAVDHEDLRDYRSIFRGGGGSSVYDFNFDGSTDQKDEQVNRANLGTDCRHPRARR